MEKLHMYWYQKSWMAVVQQDFHSMPYLLLRPIKARATHRPPMQDLTVSDEDDQRSAKQKRPVNKCSLLGSSSKPMCRSFSTCDIPSGMHHRVSNTISEHANPQSRVVSGWVAGCLACLSACLSRPLCNRPRLVLTSGFMVVDLLKSDTESEAISS